MPFLARLTQAISHGGWCRSFGGFRASFFRHMCIYMCVCILLLFFCMFHLGGSAGGDPSSFFEDWFESGDNLEVKEEFSMQLPVISKEESSRLQEIRITSVCM